MAKATKREVYAVTLELSGVEASVLLAVVGGIVGSPKGHRGVTDAIYDELYALGIRETGSFSGRFDGEDEWDGPR